jgi:hypothetical protein
MIRHELFARLHIADHWQVSLLSASFMQVRLDGLTRDRRSLLTHGTKSRNQNRTSRPATSAESQ